MIVGQILIVGKNDIASKHYSKRFSLVLADCTCFLAHITLLAAERNTKVKVFLSKIN